MYCDFLTLWDVYVLELFYYVLKLLPLETITFSDAMLSDINVVLCYVLPQYSANSYVISSYSFLYTPSLNGTATKRSITQRLCHKT
jgi:hypothetical protein